MRWSFYRMKVRDRVVCLLLFIVFWLIAIICESAKRMTQVRAEIQPPGQRSDLELRKEPRVLVALDSGGPTVVTVRHCLHGGNLVFAEFARITGTRTRNELFPTTFRITTWHGRGPHESGTVGKLVP